MPDQLPTAQQVCDGLQEVQYRHLATHAVGLREQQWPVFIPACAVCLIIAHAIAAASALVEAPDPGKARMITRAREKGMFW